VETSGCSCACWKKHRYKKTQVVNWTRGPDRARQRTVKTARLAHRPHRREARDPRLLPGHHAIRESCCPTSTSCRLAERVKTHEANWIGKSIGVRFAFTHDIRDEQCSDQRRQAVVFTTRADTIMGVTFCAVAAEHPLPNMREDNKNLPIS